MELLNKTKNFYRMPFSKKINSIKMIIHYLLNVNSFGEFGVYSIFEKPHIINNKKSIYIGKGVTIRPNLRIEAIKYYGDQIFQPKLTIGDGTTIEQNCHITCANKVSIGKRVVIAAYSMITDIEHEYKDINEGILHQNLTVKETIIGDDCFIGMGARIMPGVHIGKHCIIGTNSVVLKDIADYSVEVGIPSKLVKQYDFQKQQWVAK